MRRHQQTVEKLISPCSTGDRVASPPGAFFFESAFITRYSYVVKRQDASWSSTSKYIRRPSGLLAVSLECPSSGLLEVVGHGFMLSRGVLCHFGSFLLSLRSMPTTANVMAAWVLLMWLLEPVTMLPLSFVDVRIWFQIFDQLHPSTLVPRCCTRR